MVVRHELLVGAHAVGQPAADGLGLHEQGQRAGAKVKDGDADVLHLVGVERVPGLGTEALHLRKIQESLQSATLVLVPGGQLEQKPLTKVLVAP